MKAKLMLIFTAVLAWNAAVSLAQDGKPFKKIPKIQRENDVLSKRFTQPVMHEIRERLQNWLSDNKGNVAGKGPASIKNSMVQPGLNQVVPGSRKVWKDEKSGLPYFVMGNWPVDETASVQKTSTDAKVSHFLRKEKAMLMLNSPEEEFRIHKVSNDDLGGTHVRLQQTYKGLDVFGKDIVVHMAEDGSIRGFNGRYAPTPNDLIDVTERISSERAIQRVKADLLVQHADIETCQKMVYIRQSGEAVLVWHVIIRFGYQRWYYFIDAKSGDVVHRIDYTMTDGPTTGTGVDLAGVQQTVQLFQKGTDYYMINCSKPMYNAAQSDPPDKVTGGIVVLDIKNEVPAQNVDMFYVGSTDKNVWPANSVSMGVSVNRVFDFYANVFGRNSIDDKGMTIYAVVNLGQDYNNAYWNGFALWFGNGDGIQHSDISGAFDVIGHEYSHGVTQYTSNLIYENQSGALNEAMSDIFGSLSEYYVEGENGNWLIAEDTYTPAIPGDAMRDMEFPSGPKVQNKLPATMSDFRVLPNTEEGDWGGVHVNCSIVSRAAVLIAKSIGREKMGQIFYRAQTTYLTQSSQFIDARLACVKSAKDLYGAAEEQAVKNAFDTVEIFGADPTPPPPDYTPVEGDEWVLVVDTQNRTLNRCKTVISSQNDIELLTATTVWNKPSLSDDGTQILFVDGNNDIVGINSDGTGELNFTQGTTIAGAIKSLALSPHGLYLAFTSVLHDRTIYIMDFVAETVIGYMLYSPVTGEGAEPVYDVLFADAMDWDFDSEFLLYDCYHESQTGLGTSLDYWSINLMRVADGTIYNVFGTQPVGVNVGNPVFASTNDYIFAYDYGDILGNTSIFAANVETGEEGVIQANNYGQLGYPTYNPRDNTVAFHTPVTDGWTTWDGVAQKQLDADKINGIDGTEFVYLQYATFPVWFAIGNRADVETNAVVLPLKPGLGENYPNPFNPETTIPFQVSKKSDVRLTVFNMLGEEVAELMHETLTPGRYHVRWLGTDHYTNPVPSGIYLYRLEVGKNVYSRKMILMR